MRSVCQRLR
uniref:Uncharacterized protein n=1 Tax=Arundo donax TaxID=35708 RepID=A0A0A9G538_ARUDO